MIIYPPWYVRGCQRDQKKTIIIPEQNHQQCAVGERGVVFSFVSSVLGSAVYFDRGASHTVYFDHGASHTLPSLCFVLLSFVVFFCFFLLYFFLFFFLGVFFFLCAFVFLSVFFSANLVAQPQIVSYNKGHLVCVRADHAVTCQVRGSSCVYGCVRDCARQSCHFSFSTPPPLHIKRHIP